jgi:mutator protein MutT
VNVIDVAAGLLFHEGKLLVTQRNAAAHLGGLWEFPGGKRELEETFEDCLIRELREELGIEVRVGSPVEDLTHRYPEKTVRLRFFLCALKSGSPPPRPLQCAGLAWISQSELKDYDFPAADARILQVLAGVGGIWDQGVAGAGAPLKLKLP